MADISKERWKWIKSLRVVPRFAHVSKSPEQCGTKRKSWWAFFGSRRSEPGNTLNLGRNKAKREARRSVA